ncbi:MAG: HAD family hydrolase [Planctomycetota bacterium]
MPDKKIKAVYFDFGETLLTFGKVKTCQLLKQSAKLSYDFLKENNQPVGSFCRYRTKSIFSLYTRLWLSNITGNDFDALSLLKRIGQKDGVMLDAQQWQQFAWLWYEPLSKLAKVEPDIQKTLQKLKDMNLKLGVLSNTFVHKTSLEKHLQQLGILDFFDVCLYSYEFAFRKPDPRIFVSAVDMLGVRLPETVFVGDRIDKDIKPALEFGMTAVCKQAYTNKGKKVPKSAHSIKYISELPALIEKMNSL